MSSRCKEKKIKEREGEKKGIFIANLVMCVGRFSYERHTATSKFFYLCVSEVVAIFFLRKRRLNNY